MKTIVIISDFLEHHTLPLCESFLKQKDIKLFYFATCPTPSERISFGYEDMNAKYDFVIPVFKKGKYEKKARSILKTADLVIFGGVWGKYSKFCSKSHIPSMRISERFLKGRTNKFRVLLKVLKYKFLSRREKNFLLLACGNYATQDFRLTERYDGRILKFGYFPSVIFENNQITKESNSIVWAGRFLDWKHPEYIVDLAKFLKEKDINFSLNVVGNGPFYDSIKSSAKSLDLDDKIRFFGSKNYLDVREIMRKSEIHIFTSDYNEGWGAVLNESMESKCIPIVNFEIGASTFLIKNKENGFTYKTKEEFLKIVKDTLLADSGVKEALKQNAYLTIKNLWNSDVCVERILKLLDMCENGRFTNLNTYDDGPLSLEN